MISVDQNINIIFWHNILSEHISPLVKVLAKYDKIQVYFAYEDSKQRGWKTPDFGNATVLDSRQPQHYNFLLQFSQATDYHILSGYFSYPVAWKAFHSIRKTDAKILILSEAFEFFGIKGLLRLLRAKLQTTLWGQDIDGVLAMGQLGVRFYHMAGFPKSKIYEFSYVIESESLPNLDNPNHLNLQENTKFQILYVGKLIPRKRVDLLLKAISKLSRKDIHLTIVGEGRQANSLINLSHRLKISDQVTFLPRMTNEETLQLMSQSDLLVLPSRWDGWGAVVTEALSVGTPVICSDRCGAASIIESNKLSGSSFKNANVKSLCHILGQQLILHSENPKNREIVVNMSKKFNSIRMANYLVEILSFMMKNYPFKNVTHNKYIFLSLSVTEDGD